MPAFFSETNVRVPLIHIVQKTVAERKDVGFGEDGSIRADPSGDIVKMVLIQLDGERKGRGFSSGLWASIGGIASSIAHERPTKN